MFLIFLVHNLVAFFLPSSSLMLFPMRFLLVRPPIPSIVGHHPIKEPDSLPPILEMIA